MLVPLEITRTAYIILSIKKAGKILAIGIKIILQ